MSYLVSREIKEISTVSNCNLMIPNSRGHIQRIYSFWKGRRWTYHLNTDTQKPHGDFEACQLNPAPTRVAILALKVQQVLSWSPARMPSSNPSQAPEKVPGRVSLLLQLQSSKEGAAATVAAAGGRDSFESPSQIQPTVPLITTLFSSSYTPSGFVFLKSRRPMETSLKQNPVLPAFLHHTQLLQ